ncbi:helix-turn-helix transcriptional regulator [Actinoplanes sp. NPDC026619]|uniref:helix-turn-helix transcriptional regulator n=1 Tax=Actinoplanes sp. NPDC026619 TaxID=3155798 RepID=UPI0033E56061
MTMPRLATRSSARPKLIPLLRSSLVGELLAWIYLHPEMSYSVAELAQRFNASQRALGKEADQLADAGLIRIERRGNMRLLRADQAGPLARPLTELLALTYGPIAVLTDVLASVPGVDEAYIYGLWAERYAGVAGPPPRDVDVLVVGEADDGDLGQAAGAAERRLGREVNVYRVSIGYWRSHHSDPFLAAVRSRPICAVV